LLRFLRQLRINNLQLTIEMSLTAISPIDGRYHRHTVVLAEYFSEYALMKYRVHVEVAYLFFLAEKHFFELNDDIKKVLQQTTDKFNVTDAEKIKEIEKITNHDVKAVEYFLKEIVEKADAGHLKEWIHFGLTSQDINNTAIPLSWKHCLQQTLVPELQKLLDAIINNATQWKAVPMLARTHGQPASPTTLGKEWMVFAERLQHALQLLVQVPYSAKFGGASGNFNAHHVAYPQTDWIEFANEFVNEKLGLTRMQFTTQIEHYDSFAAHCDSLKRINTILIGLCRDVWTYISMDYFKQKTTAGEVGSSAMPHKVNPIDFENAEGNLGIANALFEHFAAKLPISRLQRDLTDSTVLRNIGVPVGHMLIALKSLEKGLGKLLLNETKLHKDLDDNWAVVAEAIQTILRRENYPEPYEALKTLTRGKTAITQTDIHTFINTLAVSNEVKAELLQISPHNYVGVIANF
jgi:adenylosuccinate lyase